VIYQKLTETELKNEDWEKNLIGMVGTSAAPGVDQLGANKQSALVEEVSVVSANQVDYHSWNRALIPNNLQYSVYNVYSMNSCIYLHSWKMIITLVPQSWV
jgi:hypothetical protein